MALIYLAEFALFSLILGFDTMHLEGICPDGHPQADRYSIAVLDLITSLITLSTLTAVLFARMNSIETLLRFSRQLCISNLNNGHLDCRFITTGRSQWLNVRYTLSLIYDEEIEPGAIAERQHTRHSAWIPIYQSDQRRSPGTTECQSPETESDRSGCLQPLSL